MGRPLSTREREVLEAMIQHADDSQLTGPDAVSPARRQRWLEQAAFTGAGRRCVCGTCPTIDLEDRSEAPLVAGPRVVLSASSPGALLLLFVDAGRLSCLELAPLDADASILEFPPVEAIRFG